VNVVVKIIAGKANAKVHISIILLYSGRVGAQILFISLSKINNKFKKKLQMNSSWKNKVCKRTSSSFNKITTKKKQFKPPISPIK
jgi:hypothetical protein